MKTNIKRVKNKKELEEAIEDAQVEGWKLDTRGEKNAVLKKSGNFGGILGHFIVFVLTVWWTFLLGNMAYAGYQYLITGQELRIKVKVL